MSRQEEPLWSIAEGKYNDGKPYIIRFLEFYPTEEEQEKYHLLIEITWAYEESNSSGMPDQETYDKMNLFEDVLSKEIEPQEFCLFVLTFTGAGKKIWQVYSTDIDLFMDKLNESMTDKEVLPLQIEGFQDKEWNGYKEFIGLVQ